MNIRTKSLKMAILVAFTSFALASLLFNDTANVKTFASVGGPPASRTGAPGELTCTACHTANSGPGTITIIAPATYTPGQTYNMQVVSSTTDSSRRAWGFELTSLTAAAAAAGTFTNTTTFTRTRTGSGKNYVEQTATGTFPTQPGATWNFSWTAPAADVGPVTFYAAGIHGDNDGTEDGDQTYTTSLTATPAVAVVIHHGFTDFDGDGKADASIFRPSAGFWYLNRSTAGLTGAQLGISTDKLTPADFDGDDKADIAVWRDAPADAAAFYILQSSTNTVRTELFGQSGDDPTSVGDWDGDGKADPAVFRPSAVGAQSYIYYRGSLNNPGGGITYVPWGTSGDIPIRGDFDGDGRSDPAVFRPSTATYYIAQSSNGTIRYDAWGLAGDKFVPADYDGDGKTDLAVFRNGIWYIKQSSNSQAVYYSWGLNTDTLVPADFDGDGKTDPAVYRNGIWYVRLSSSGSLSIQNFGLATDRPIAGSFVK